MQVVNDIAPAVEGCGPGQVVDLDTNTWEIEFKEQPEASFSPGHAEEGCDWSGDENDPEVVEAVPASSKAEPEEDDPMGVELGDDSQLEKMKHEPVQEAASILPLGRSSAKHRRTQGLTLKGALERSCGSGQPRSGFFRRWPWQRRPTGPTSKSASKSKRTRDPRRRRSS